MHWSRLVLVACERNFVVKRPKRLFFFDFFNDKFSITMADQVEVMISSNVSDAEKEE